MTNPTLCTKRGDTWNPVFTYTDGAGNPINLTGCSARLQARAETPATASYTRSTAAEPAAYEAPVIDVSTGTGEISVDGPNGKVLVVVEAADMDIAVGDYDTDLELTYPDGTVKSTETMVLTVVEDVTYD